MELKLIKSFFCLILLAVFICCKYENNADEFNIIEKPDISHTFLDSLTVENSNLELKFEKEKESLLLQGWKEEYIHNGIFPLCYNFKPISGDIKNYLKVDVGSGTDVAIKLMDFNTDKCVRFVFINKNSSFTIKNIPEGLYYLKIAYGKNWLSKVQNGQCIGKFLRNAIYEKGEDILDFNIQYNENGYDIPVYKLQLDVIATNAINSFNSQEISENEFNQ